MDFPKELKPAHVTAIIDTREQRPLNLNPLQTITTSLDTGDYSVQGLEHIISVERKSIDDLLMCVGQERERFDREMQRILAYPIRTVVVEGTLAQVEKGEYRSKVHPNAAVGSILSWQAKGIPFMWCDNPEIAGRHIAKFLFSAARNRYRENLAFMSTLDFERV